LGWLLQESQTAASKDNKNKSVKTRQIFTPSKELEVKEVRNKNTFRIAL
jgi:hypothetical protein